MKNPKRTKVQQKKMITRLRTRNQKVKAMNQKIARAKTKMKTTLLA